MRVLDDLFYKKEENYEELKQLERKFFKRTLYLFPFSVIIWFYAWANLAGVDTTTEDKIDILYEVILTNIISPPFLSAFLALFLALVAYKDFSYLERFPRVFLLILSNFYIFLICLGIIAII